LTGGAVVAEMIAGIYLAGDVVLTEGSRSIQAEELYYDIATQRALAVQASLTGYDAKRGIPIYLRAKRLRQESADVFSAEESVLTTSEFHTPQIALTASRVILRDRTQIDTTADTPSDTSRQVELRDVRFKYYNTTLLKLPKVTGNLENPHLPLRGLRLGNDSFWGPSVESQWDFPKVLGLAEAPGTDSRLNLDYYDRRGPGVGLDVDYQRDSYFGESLVYYINDHGQDRLGRHSTRWDLEPERTIRGRFTWRHRQFLPHYWQVTTEAAYLSDRNFLEQYYRGEAQAGKEHETLIHSKRIQDNWGLSFLAKARINDFQNQLEELPSAEFNWTGQSLFDGLMTFHSNSLVASMRQRYDRGTVPAGLDSAYSFLTTRNELDLPLSWGRWRMVPYAAATFGYDDGSGFMADRQGAAVQPERDVLIGEAGLRVTAPSWWRIDRNVYSRFWDLHQLRHVVSPSLLIVGYAEDKAAAEQRDLLRLGLTQRWQTKRGQGKRRRTVEWLRLDLDWNWLARSARSGGNSNELQWNVPMTPLIDRFSHTAPPADRRRGNMDGPNRSYVGGRLAWHVSDSTAVLGDVYYDMVGGLCRRASAGVAHVCAPDLSAYFGTRYLRDTDNLLGQIGSHVFTFAATYRLDPRYAVVVSNQFDFEYKENIRSDVALVRRYHRLSYALTFGVDESLDRTSMVFSLWPQGIDELALGLSRYMGLGL
jgi:hypothetical protein